jgi:cysteinyl-tRNA synthetase
MSIKLYNTLTRRKEVFKPIDAQRVTMYVCGPTVYNYAHIGNARPPVVFDLLSRLLRRHYRQVVYARNITDVDDKIMNAARKQDVAISEITDFFANAYRADMAQLGVIPPDIEPCATDHIDEMVGMIEQLIKDGHAYESESHVLFEVSTFPGYGELSGRCLDDLQVGARVEVADYKRAPADFVLWKPSSEEQPGWHSPWGRGRPGWHLECSAMSEAHLGDTIDIHGGGNDLKFPHHENERAQSICAHAGKPFANYWVHNGFVTMNSDKMSKSEGNVVTVHELLNQYPGEVLRLVLMTAHYRQPLDWSEEAINQAGNQLDRIYRALDGLTRIEVPADLIEPPAPLLEALEDDLNTPKALSVLSTLVSDANNAETPKQQQTAKAALLAAGELLGLLQEDPGQWLKGQAPQSTGAKLDETSIDEWVAKRTQARNDRDFAESDRIRDFLNEHGIVLDDGPDGSRWRFER